MDNRQQGADDPRPESDSTPASESPDAQENTGDTAPPESEPAKPQQPVLRPAEGSVARGSAEPRPDASQEEGAPEETIAPSADAPESSLTDLAREASRESEEPGVESGEVEAPALEPGAAAAAAAGSESPAEHTAADDTFHRTDYDDYTYEYGEDSSFHDDSRESVAEAAEPVEPAEPVLREPQPGGALAAPPAPPPPASTEPDEEEDDEDDEGMLRMSFLDHLEELRNRIIKALIGVGVAFLVAIFFSEDLWRIVQEPAKEALKEIGSQNQNLIAIKPTEQFNVIWIKLPVLAAIFLASPWLLYQVWAFIAPGLYKRERRWAAPFVIVSAGLFILGGLFAYFIAFRFGLTFLLGIGRDIEVVPFVTIEEYFDLFVNVVLVIGLVFELPVLIFFLTLLRIVSPRFLMQNTRYAVLAIVILAAVVTPTPDVMNLMMFSVPMLLLYFIGVFASYLLVLQRERRRFPWFKVALVLGIIVVAAIAAITISVAFFNFQLVPQYPFLIR